jgi:hypothetical protein
MVAAPKAPVAEKGEPATFERYRKPPASMVVLGSSLARMNSSDTLDIETAAHVGTLF